MEGSINGSKEAREKEYAICHQPYPWLMLCDGQFNKRQMFYSITHDTYHIRFISELHENKFFTTSNKKWLVVQDESTYECFLLNISNMEKVPLPPLEDLNDYPTCALSSSLVMDSTCRVVLFYCMPGSFLSCNLGDAEFVNRELIIEVGKKDTIVAAVNFKEKLYALTINYHLVTADFSDPLLVFKPIIKGTDALKNVLPSHHERHLYLVESCGDLFLVYTRDRDRELKDLKIYKADFSIHEWVRVKDLGDRTIFLDARSSSSFTASRFGLRGNCVYFVNKRGRNLFIFDLGDESISILCPVRLPTPTRLCFGCLFWKADLVL